MLTSDPIVVDVLLCLLEAFVLAVGVNSSESPVLACSLRILSNSFAALC